MAEQDCSLLLPCGFEYEFVSAVFDEYHCLICQLPLREPVLTRCGHRYCKKCLDEAIRRQEAPECPADREPLDPEKDIFPDKAAERNILSCHVKCPSKGCEWTGETRYVESHLEICDCKIIPCLNSNCQMTMERKLLEDHVVDMCQWRMVHCGYCEEGHAKCNEEEHASVCLRFPTNCSNGCDEILAREEIMNHIMDDCPLTLIRCPYFEMGCKMKVQRKQMESHLQLATAVHLDLACVKLNDTQAQLSSTQAQLKNTQARLNDTQFQFNITQETTTELVKRVDELQIQLEEKLNDEKQNQAVEKVVMEMKKKKSFTWKIDGFSGRLRLAKAGIKNAVESVPFYSDDCGYKLQASLHPYGNGSGKRTHLSLFIKVLEGEYDAILPWPLQKRVWFRLIDQQPPTSVHLAQNVTDYFMYTIHDKPHGDGSKSRGCPRFITHEKLKTRRYLVDDTLFLQIEVAPLFGEVGKPAWSTSSLHTATKVDYGRLPMS